MSAHAPTPHDAPGAGSNGASSLAPPPSWQAEREALYELLAHEQRVAQVGLVTSGLAHDVMNGLQLISGAAQVALLSRDPLAARDALEKVTAHCQDVAEITRALLQFVKRRDAPEEAVFPIEDCMATAERLVAPLARVKRVTLSRRTSGTPQARGDSRLLVQAVVNLVTNAIHACSQTSGRVEVSASRLPDGTGKIEIADTGPGIPEAIRGRIFRPFESGRGPSGGNGLGLFIVRQSLRRLHGTIRVRSSPDGTRFTLLLPSVGGEPSPAAEREPTALPAARDVAGLKV